MTGLAIRPRFNAYRGVFQPEYTSKNRGLIYLFIYLKIYFYSVKELGFLSHIYKFYI